MTSSAKYSVDVIGHSQLSPLSTEFSAFSALLQFHKINIRFFCAPGATCSSIVHTVAFSEICKWNPHLILVFLGGNDLIYGAEISIVYESLKCLVDELDNTCKPYFGISVIEPEPRLGNPRYIDTSGYRALRNSLVRKIKDKRYLRFLPLVKFGLSVRTTKADGVHFNPIGIRCFIIAIRSHISKIIFKNSISPIDI